MDPITSAIVAALAGGLATGLTKIGESLVGDAYNALKAALSRKFGKKSKVLKAVSSLEADPGLIRAQEALSNSVKDARADQDWELLRLAADLSRAVININQNAGDNAVQIGQGNTISGVVAQSFHGNYYSINQGPIAPSAQDLLMRGVQLVRARSYSEAGTLLSQSLLVSPSGDGNYYHALALLQGKRPKVLTYSQAIAIRKKLVSACALDSSKGHYWYFRALVEYDFFLENGFSDGEEEIEDLVDTGDRCRFVRAFVLELLEQVPAPSNEVYRYLRQKL